MSLRFDFRPCPVGDGLGLPKALDLTLLLLPGQQSHEESVRGAGPGGRGAGICHHRPLHLAALHI